MNTSIRLKFHKYFFKVASLSANIQLKCFSNYQEIWEFPGSPGMRPLCYHGGGPRFDPCRETKIP